MSRPFGRAAAVCLAAVLLLSQGAAVQGRARAPTFDVPRANAAREALAQLPQAIHWFRAGRYAEAALAFDGILAQLPETASDVSAAALLHLDGPEHYRPLRAALH